MALSGSFQNYPVNQFGLYCTWSGTQSQTGNYTDVTLNVYLRYYTLSVGARTDGIININGTSETFSTSSINDMSSTSYHNVLLKSKIVRVYHNSNGTKTGVTLSASWRFSGTYSGTYVGTITASTSVDLNPIDRSAPTVSAAVTIISSTSITIRGTANKTCNKWEYTLNSGSSWSTLSTASGTSVGKTLTGITSKNYASCIKVRATRSDNGVAGTSSAISADITVPTVSFTVSSITANSCYINAKSSVTANLWQYSTNNGGSWVQFSTTEGASATRTITGLNPNTTYQIKVRVRKKSNGLYGESSATSVKTLGASVLNTVNALTVDVTSPTLSLNWTVYDASYTHSLAIRYGTVIVTITGLTGSTGTNNKTVSLTSAQRTSILNAMSTAQNISVTYVLTTYSGSTQIGTTSSATGTIKTTSTTSAPTFTSFTFLDNNSTTVGVTGNNQLCIQSYSSLRVSCTAATAKNGASISKYRATIGTKTVESTSTTISFGAITDTGNLTLTVTAVDSRGYTKSVSKSITVIAYERIVINSWNIRRVNNVEETIQLSFEGSLSPVMVNGVAKNTFVRARYRYKKTTATSYNSYATIDNVSSSRSGFSFTDNAFIELPATYPYHVQIEVSDKLDTYTATLYIDKGTPLVSFRSEKVGINTNDPRAALDVNGDTMVSGDIKMRGYNVQGFIKALDTSTNLNDVLTSGIYYTPMGSTALNYPVTNAVGVLEVIQVADYFILQRYTSVSGQIYSRGKYNTTWHAWA